MKINTVLRVLSMICLVVSCAMLPALAVSLYDGTYDAPSFALSILAGLSVSFSLMLMSGSKGINLSMGIREGVGVTGFSWLIASAVGALPYRLSGAAETYTDAYFEAMSGFTTTGATILTDIEAMPRGILLWRSLTHWAGGMGIIVLSLAVLPFLGVSGMEMYKAEVPGITAGKLTPRLHQTAIRLWAVYILFTFTEMILLIFGGMNIFDAFCHSCSTIATGGFSTKNNSIAYFRSAYIQWVIIIFMLLAGVNFSLYFMIPSKRLKDIFSDEEFCSYIKIAVISSALIAISLYVSGTLSGCEYIIRQSVFHVSSIMTTTGFIVEDYDYWPEAAKCVIVMIMFIGACGGSTGGGCKVSRFIILARHLGCEVRKLLHPKSVITPRMDGRQLPQGTIDSAGAFMILYLFILGICTLITAMYGIDMLTAFTGVLTCLSNVGPGLNELGAQENFSLMPAGVKWVFSFCMFAGRLELFAALLLISPGTYRK